MSPSTPDVGVDGLFGGYSEGVVSLLQNSWIKGTIDQYQTYLNKWANFCKINKIETLNASIDQGVEFLNYFILLIMPTQL